MELELLGYVPDWGLIMRVGAIAGPVGFIINVVGVGITILFVIISEIRRWKDKTERAKTEHEAQKAADEISKQIFDLGESLNLFIDGLPFAPNPVREAYHKALIAVKEWDMEEARQLLLNVLTLTTNYRSLSAIHLSLGLVYYYQSDIIKSRNQYKRALQMATYAEDLEGRVWALNGLGLTERILGNYNVASAYHRDGLEAAEGIGNDNARATHIGNIGLVLMDLGDLYGALNSFYKALDIHRSNHYPIGEAIQLGNIGSVLMDQGDLVKALKANEEALKIDRSIRNSLGEAQDLGNIGLVLMYKGDHEGAFEAHWEAIEIYRRIGNELGEADELGNVGLVLMYRSDLIGALEAHRKALEIHRSKKNPLGEANDLSNIGLVITYKGNLDRALEYHYQALAIHRSIGERLGEARDLGNIGLVFVEKGKPTEAIRYLEEALESFESIGASLDEKIAKKNLERAKVMLEGQDGDGE